MSQVQKKVKISEYSQDESFFNQKGIDFDAESVEISRSSNPEKKLMAIFKDKDGKKIKTTHFGQRGASD